MNNKIPKKYYLALGMRCGQATQGHQLRDELLKYYLIKYRDFEENTFQYLLVSKGYIKKSLEIIF